MDSGLVIVRAWGIALYGMYSSNAGSFLICNASRHSSNAGEPMWFRGKANLAAVLDELQTHHGVAAATEVRSWASSINTVSTSFPHTHSSQE